MARRIRGRQALLRVLARESLPQIFSFFQAAGGNRIITFNNLRSWYNLGSQAEARDLFNFAVDYSGTLSGLQRDTELGTITAGDVPLARLASDPLGFGRRFRYEITVGLGDNFFNIPIDSDSLLTQAEIAQDVQATLNDWMVKYPDIAQFVNEFGLEQISSTIRTLTRRY